jgi:molybdopterin synthase sulfur carrier subunit
MRIELKLYASLSRYMPEEWRDSPTVEANEGITVKGLLETMKVPPEAVKLVFLNGLHAKGDEVLREGDRVGVFPPVAGG